MSYQVLARKWRPQNFSELVGQSHVQRALTNALENDRLHHAYLFTGTRGVGKTTIARILAKALNCEQAVTATPCGQCSSCQEITEGRFVDLIEVDAASRTKVEDTRDLLDNVQYAPTKGRYKVYLIDEVHMLSNHSFNALLKTLEEPPPHVKFLLATTDPQRLPVTILSRCLQFHLKRLTIPEISQHIGNLLDKENIPYEPESISYLATAADGSIRDALSLLDQAISFGAGKLQSTDVRDMLGAIEHHDIGELLHALAESNPERVLKAVANIADYSMEFDQVLGDLVSAFHQIALLQLSPTSVDSSIENFSIFQDVAKQISPEDIQLYYQIALLGRRDLNLTPDSKIGLEMTLLRMLAFKPVQPGSGAGANKPASSFQPTGQQTSQATNPSTAKPASRPQSSESRSIQAERATQDATVIADAPKGPAKVQPDIQKSPAGTTAAATIDWEQIATNLDLAGMARQLALHCSLQTFRDNVLRLQLGKNQAHLLSDSRREAVANAVQQFIPNVTLDIQLADDTAGNTPAELQEQRKQDRINTAIDDINNDKAVQQFQEIFDATVTPDSVQPLENQHTE